VKNLYFCRVFLKKHVVKHNLKNTYRILEAKNIEFIDKEIQQY